jgi:NAD+ diphosphatase
MIAYSGNPLDRAGDKRGDAEWLTALRCDPRARILPLCRLQPLLKETGGEAVTELRYVSGADFRYLGGEGTVEVFLGLADGIAYFARDVSGADDAFVKFGTFKDARAAAALLSYEEVAIVGQAKALVDWHLRHKFCAQCGASTKMADAGYKRVCAACGAEHFPRTDPAVIMLVTEGDSCLLARNRRFTAGFSSALAGFVEPGESIEEAVAREVMEEVGLSVARVRYFASQPWPFPSSLMIGCFAESRTREIKIDGKEIIAAEWFARDAVKLLLSGERRDILLPRRDAIAYHLVKTWAEED